MAEKKPPVPAWGYKKDTGEPKLFENGKLEAGYEDTPAKCDAGDK